MLKFEIIYNESLDSTNLECLRKAEVFSHGTVVTADTQTAGMGRSGRTWESPKAENLYFSVLLKLAFEKEKAPMLTILMAIAVARAIIKTTGADAQIKWPNDIVINGKKVCGILTQMQVTETGAANVVIGTGINVNQELFNTEVLPYASSIKRELGKAYDRDALLQEVLVAFCELYEQFAEVGNLSFVQAEYEEFLANRLKVVRVLDPKGEYEAVALGVNKLGELIVGKEDGTIEKVYAGEVSVRGLYGYV